MVGDMPRTGRASIGNLCYHGINRGNDRAVAGECQPWAALWEREVD